MIVERTRKPWKHNGRLMPWKRKLSKARRRAWRDSHERGLVGIESTVNWKDW